MYAIPALTMFVLRLAPACKHTMEQPQLLSASSPASRTLCMAPCFATTAVSLWLEERIR